MININTQYCLKILKDVDGNACKKCFQSGRSGYSDINACIKKNLVPKTNDENLL